MKKGDEIILLIHGYGETSEEKGNIIYSIDNEKLKLEDLDSIFYKNKDGIYKTKESDSPFGMWFEIKELSG